VTFQWWKINSFNKRKKKYRLSDPRASKRSQEHKYATMKFSGGTLSILLAATAVAASVFQNNPSTTSRNGIQARPFFGVSKAASNQALVNGISAVPRGGSSGEDSENSEEDVPVDLYLPGLLGTTVAKKAVSYFLLQHSLASSTWERCTLCFFFISHTASHLHYILFDIRHSRMVPQTAQSLLHPKRLRN